MKALLVAFCLMLGGCAVTVESSSERTFTEYKDAKSFPGSNEYGEVVLIVQHLYTEPESAAMIGKSIAACPNLSEKLLSIRHPVVARMWWASPSIAVPSTPVYAVVPLDLQNKITKGSAVHVVARDNCLDVTRITAVRNAK